MNDTQPLTADQVDELLSADLDGEFDDAARDLGLDPADARARLANEVRGVDDRRAALAAARDALAEAPAVDDLLAARVRAKAMKAAASAHGDQQADRARRSRRLYAVAASLAAAIAIVAGIALTLRDSNTSRKSSTAAKANGSTSANVPAPGASTRDVDFGAFADVPSLVARLRSAEALVGDSAGNNTQSKSPTASKETARKQTVYALAPCDATAKQLSGASTLTRRGAATVAGVPVRVYVFRRGTDDIVVVLSADCRLVSRQTLPATSG